MNAIYIDNNQVRAAVFGNLVAEHGFIALETFDNARKAILTLMEKVDPPAVIAIHCSVNDISCKALIEFIRSRENLNETKVLIISHHFTEKEKRQYIQAGASECIALDFNTDCLNSFIRNCFVLTTPQ